MSSVVYFGTKDKQSWIKSPRSGLRASSIGWSAKTQLLNGRASVRRSSASHREFNAEWFGDLNLNAESSMQEIKNYADGLYGDGPYYWIDPFSASQNVLPPHWAAPMLTENDWPNLATGIVPTYTKSSIGATYPIKYATYVTTDAYESTNKLVLIIPAGYTLHFGWHGPTTADVKGVRIVPYTRTGGNAGTALNPDKIDASGTVPTNTTVSGDTYSYVEIFIATDLESTVNISGMIAQILPSSKSAPTGGFVAGKGTTALEFENSPDIEYYSSATGNGQVGMSANLVEV